MIKETAKILTDGLGAENVVVSHLNALVAKVGDGGLAYLEVACVLVAWAAAAYAVMWQDFSRVKRRAKARAERTGVHVEADYLGWVSDNVVGISLRMVVTVVVSWLLFVGPLVPIVAKWAISLFVFDGANNAGLGFLFGYDYASPQYKLFNTGRWVLAVALAVTAAIAGTFHHVVFRGDAVETGMTGEPLDVGKIFRRAAAAFAAVMLVAFTTLPELALNGVLSFFSDKTVFELVTGKKQEQNK